MTAVQRTGAPLGKNRVRNPSRFSAPSNVGKVVVRIVLLVYALGSLIPILFLVLAPSKTGSELINLNPLAYGNIEHYAQAWGNLMAYENGIVLQWMANSLWYTAAIVVLSCAVGISAGYALAATDLPFRRTFLTVTLIAMVIPPVSLIVPLFIEVSQVGLFDTPLAVIITGSFFPFGVFLSYIHFSTAIPQELYEAARIDGNSEFGIFWRIALPLSKGTLGMLAFFSFSATWVNYFLPYVLLGTPSNFSLPVGLGILFSSTPALNPGHGTESTIGRPEIALAGLLLSLPILIVFLLSSRLLSRGVLSGAVKS